MSTTHFKSCQPKEVGLHACPAMKLMSAGEKERAEGAAQQHGGDPEGAAQQEARHHPDRR